MLPGNRPTGGPERFAYSLELWARLACDGGMRPSDLLRCPIGGIEVDDSSCDVDDLAFCGGVQVRVPAAGPWGDLVALAVASDWVGIEALAAVPGTVADAVTGDASAFGQSVWDTLSSVRTWDRAADTQATFPVATLRPPASPLGERLADGGPRYEILDVSFLFRQGDLSTPIHDARLAALLGIREGRRVALAEIRRAVLRV